VALDFRLLALLSVLMSRIWLLCHADGASSKALPNKELQHVQQLLAAYEAAQGAGASTAAATANGNTQKPPAAAADVDGVGEGGASWAAEEYEPDNVQCMQRSYLKFMKRIARQPQQCAR
jgi:hypothetical protein